MINFNFTQQSSETSPIEFCDNNGMVVKSFPYNKFYDFAEQEMTVHSDVTTQNINGQMVAVEVEVDNDVESYIEMNFTEIAERFYNKMEGIG